MNTQTTNHKETDMPQVPATHPVRPLRQGSRPYLAAETRRDLAQCGTCLRYWDDGISTSITPTPSGRCPFEYYHPQETDMTTTNHAAEMLDGLTATDVLGDIRDIFNRGTDTDGWDLSILDRVAGYLGELGYIVNDCDTGTVVVAS